MKYAGFEISNFKGIQKISFDFTRNPQFPIYILVGLNESGKTTVLEALSFFYDNLQKKDEVKLRLNVVNDVHDLIPKGKKDNFNDKIYLKCKLLLDDEDISNLNEALKPSAVKVNSYDSKMEITQQFGFSNSAFIKKETVWDVKIMLSGGAKQASVKLWNDHPAWNPAYTAIVNMIPSIIYYPNFLFDFPDRIYLEKAVDETKEQVFYRQVLQDILDSLDNSLTLDLHVIARAKSGKPSDRDALESVLNKMSSQITKLVFDNRFSIFKINAGSKEIFVTYPKEDPTTNRLFVELKLKEGQDSYYIRERSLGFRWFFTFLLFTQFRVTRTKGSKNLFFLFDEPASNLHQSAQQKLLLALEQLTCQNSVSVIYSTHSHHLIHQNWLESAYIVRNKALDYENEDKFDTTMTDISVEKYRTFVGSYPAMRNYYQPILDVLEYKPSNLENVPDVIMVEGKNDYYSLTYMFKVVLQSVRSLNFAPGNGAGSLENLIKLYYAWGRRFIILLDSDGEGQIQKERYKKIFGGIIENRIYTLGDIDASWYNKGMEKIFINDEKMTIQKSVFPDSKVYRKKQFNLSIQENLMKKNCIVVSDATIKSFQKIIAFLEDKLTSV